MKTYQKAIVFALITLIGVPTVAFGGSFTLSLIDGKTPSEAVSVLAEQIDSLFGRVDNLEATQAQILDTQAQQANEINQLKGSADAGLTAGAAAPVSAGANAKSNLSADPAQCATIQGNITALEGQIASLNQQLAQIRSQYQSSDSIDNTQNSSDERAAYSAKVKDIQSQVSTLEDQKTPFRAQLETFGCN